MIELNPKVVEACITGIKHIQDNIYKFNNTLYVYYNSHKLNTRTYELIFKEYSQSYVIIKCRGGSTPHSAIRYDGFNKCDVVLTDEAKKVLQYYQNLYFYEKGRKVRRVKAIAERKKVKCPICGKEFTPYHKKMCCSKECSRKYVLMKAKEKRNETLKVYHKVCPTCGKPFITHTDAQRYCSEACRIKRNNNYMIAKNKRNSYTVKKCLNCGKEFYGSPRMVHCCGKCREAYNYKKTLERRRKAKLNLVQTTK